MNVSMHRITGVRASKIEKLEGMDRWWRDYVFEGKNGERLVITLFSDDKGALFVETRD